MKIQLICLQVGLYHSFFGKYIITTTTLYITLITIYYIVHLAPQDILVLFLTDCQTPKTDHPYE